MVSSFSILLIYIGGIACLESILFGIFLSVMLIVKHTKYCVVVVSNYVLRLVNQLNIVRLTFPNTGFTSTSLTPR